MNIYLHESIKQPLTDLEFLPYPDIAHVNFRFETLEILVDFNPTKSNSCPFNLQSLGVFAFTELMGFTINNFYVMAKSGGLILQLDSFQYLIPVTPQTDILLDVVIMKDDSILKHSFNCLECAK